MIGSTHSRKWMRFFYWPGRLLSERLEVIAPYKRLISDILRFIKKTAGNRQVNFPTTLVNGNFEESNYFLILQNVFMKKICYMIVLLLSVQFIIAQAPMAFNYQGVARNAQGQALSNQTIKVRASLVKNIDGGISIVTFYTETRTVTTNQLGLFSFKIGDDPAALTGSITNGQWNDGNTTQHLKIELDVNNSGTWTDMGTQQIVSVPYALYAGEAAKAKELTQASVAFGASSKMPQTFLANETDWVAFDALESNSTGFNLSTDAFTAQASGMHQFTGIIWATPINTVTSNSYVYVYLYVNGVAKTKFRYLARANESSITCPFSTNLYLNKNDVVKVYFQNSTAVPIDAGSSTSLPHTFFSGHLIR